MVICLRFAHSMGCSFVNIMSRREPFGACRRPSASGSGDDDVPNFIRCVDGRYPKIHEVWTFGEDGVTPEVYQTACVDVSDFLSECFATNYLTQNWRRIPMFRRIYINGSVEWLRVPDFLSNDGPPWTLNILDLNANWGDRWSSTSPNLGSGSEGNSDSVSINWNCSARVLPVNCRIIFDKSRSDSCRAHDNLHM